MTEVIVKFSVSDLDSFYDWLQSAIDGDLYVTPDRAGYDAYYTLVKDGKAMTDFEPHLKTEERQAAAIEQALRMVNGEDNDDIVTKSAIALSVFGDCDGVTLSRVNTTDFDGLPYRNEIVVESRSEASNRIAAAINNLYSE